MGHILHTHTHTHAAKLVVRVTRIMSVVRVNLNLFLCESCFVKG